MPGTLNLTADRGATFQLHLEWSDDEEEIDLTDAVAVMKVRPRIGRGSTIPILVLRDSAAGAGELNSITLGAGTGQIDIELTSEETLALAVGIYVYDLLITLPIGTAVKLLEGTFTVQETQSL